MNCNSDGGPTEVSQEHFFFARTLFPLYVSEISLYTFIYRRAVTFQILAGSEYFKQAMNYNKIGKRTKHNIITTKVTISQQLPAALKFTSDDTTTFTERGRNYLSQEWLDVFLVRWETQRMSDHQSLSFQMSTFCTLPQVICLPKLRTEPFVLSAKKVCNFSCPKLATLCDRSIKRQDVECWCQLYENYSFNNTDFQIPPIYGALTDPTIWHVTETKTLCFHVQSRA